MMHKKLVFREPILIVVLTPPPPGDSVRLISCLTSQSTIFQSMWRHIDVQADGRSWTYGRAPNALDIS